MSTSASELLEQFIPTVENIPSEIKFLCSGMYYMYYYVCVLYVLLCVYYMYYYVCVLYVLCSSTVIVLLCVVCSTVICSSNSTVIVYINSILIV